MKPRFSVEPFLFLALALSVSIPPVYARDFASKQEFQVALEKVQKESDRSPNDIELAYKELRLSSEAFLPGYEFCMPEGKRLQHFMQLCNKAIEKEPGKGKYFCYRGIARSFDMYNTEGMLSDLDKGLQLEPLNADALQLRAHMYELNGNDAKALKDLDALEQVRPDDAAIKTAELMSRRNYIRTLELIEKAVKVAPRRSEPYLCRAIYYMARDQYQKAFADLTTAASLRQVDEQIYQLRAYCQYKLGNYEAGLVDCKKALDLLPTYGLAFRNQGLLRDKLGDTKGAMWSYRDALTWDVRDIDTELKYADLCYKCGESSQCRVYVDNAFDVMKDPPAVAYLLRGRMAIDRQNFIDALRDYAKGCWKLVFEKRQDSLYGYYR